MQQLRNNYFFGIILTRAAPADDIHGRQVRAIELCNISDMNHVGEVCFVTSMGNGSISEAHTGVIPFRTAASGKPPMPSNRLPIVSSLMPQPPLRRFL